MMNTSLPVVVKKVKFDYDRTDPKQVYEAVKQFYPQLTAKDFTPKLVQNFIPEGACPRSWLITLRNVEYNARNPKKSKRSRTKTGYYNRKYNPAEAVARRVLTDALMGVA